MKRHTTANTAPILENDTVEVSHDGPHDGLTGTVIAKDEKFVTIETPTGDSRTFPLKDVRRVDTPTTGVELKGCDDSKL